MSFASKIKKLREDKDMTQAELAKALGTSLKTISNYETKDMRPRTHAMYEKIATFFEVDINYLLTIEDDFVINAKEKYGYKGLIDAKNILESSSALFAGGSLPEEDKDKLFEAIQEAYWKSKLENKKYGRNKK